MRCRNILVILSLICHTSLLAQDGWVPTAIRPSGRYDDIFFLNENTGWAAGGDYKIYRTDDAGLSWVEQLAPGKYLRSIEFLTDEIGFCGSLDSSLYRTNDGGATWVDIASSISPRPVGFCGLSSPDSMTIYGCGIWRSPAYIIRSTDRGNSWTYLNMSAYASALVDVLFTSRDTGFAIGTANPSSQGGVILYTTTGGASWQTVHKTGVAEDIVWKIQSPDRKNYFASVSANPGTKNTRILKSTNGGMNWSPIIIRSSFHHLQVVGFIDSLKGWAGDDDLFETTDGGVTWQPILASGAGFNRFFRVSNTTAYLAGGIVYRQKFNVVTSLPPGPQQVSDQHTLKASPNPSAGKTEVEMFFTRATFASLTIISYDGKLIQRLFHDRVPPGKKIISFDMSAYSGGNYFIVLRTHEGLIYKQVLKQG